MKLHILSDLHLNTGAFDIADTGADVVVLAGDIARPEAAIAWASGIGKPVLYVPGNHEFYGAGIGDTLERLAKLCAGTGIRVLDNDEATIAGVRFLGTTLWTDFMLFGDGERRDIALAEARRLVRDFSRIRGGGTPEALFTPADAAALFERDARWLADRLAAPCSGSTVVITHHAPSPRSIHPRFADSLLNPCFASDAEHLLDGTRAALWVHGHMHDSFDYRVNGTRVVCNPRGYVMNGKGENPRFDPAFVVEID